MIYRIMGISGVIMLAAVYLGSEEMIALVGSVTDKCVKGSGS